MEIGKINNLNVNNTASDSKAKAADDEFERRLKNAVDNKDDKELKKVCKDFEGIILRMMYKEMRATVPKSDLIPSEAGKEIFESMLDDELMEEASKSSGIGLADVLYKQLNKQAKSSYNHKTDEKSLHQQKGEEKVAGEE